MEYFAVTFEDGESKVLRASKKEIKLPTVSIYNSPVRKDIQEILLGDWIYGFWSQKIKKIEQKGFWLCKVMKYDGISFYFLSLFLVFLFFLFLLFFDLKIYS